MASQGTKAGGDARDGDQSPTSLSPRNSQSTLLGSPTEMTAMDKESEYLLNPVDRGAPGDSNSTAPRSAEETQLSRRKSQFYSDVFAYREENSPRDMALQSSTITADIKTNVIIQDEFSCLTSFSSFLSQRYQRPETTILITLSHSACLLFGGSFDPAYHCTISGLPSFIQSTLNKRNAALIQAFFNEKLKVPAHRGCLRFDAIPEDNLATNGMTVTAVLDQSAEFQSGGGGRRRSSIRKGSVTDGVPLLGKVRKDSLAISGRTPRMSTRGGVGPGRVDTLRGVRKKSLASGRGGGFAIEEIPEEGAYASIELPERGPQRRKSIMQMFGK